MQIDFDKRESHDKELQELAYFMTVQRTSIAVVIGTARALTIPTVEPLASSNYLQQIQTIPMIPS
ncbi:MAG: hypothetical protein ACXADO_11070 [Candidatus Thorarchaeota archaeon]